MTSWKQIYFVGSSKIKFFGFILLGINTHGSHPGYGSRGFSPGNGNFLRSSFLGMGDFLGTNGSFIHIYCIKVPKKFKNWRPLKYGNHGYYSYCPEANPAMLINM